MKNLSGGRFRGVGAILGAVLVALVASTAGAASLEEVIEKSIKAQGGREALTSLKSLERKGTVEVDGAFGQMEGNVEEIVVPGKKACRALDLAVFVQKDAWNGEVAWREGMSGVQKIEGDEANMIKQSASLNPFLGLGDDAKLEKLDDETIDDVAYYVIQLTSDSGPPIKMYINQENDQITRTTLTQNNPQFGEVELTMALGAYEQFGPVKLPTKQTISIGEILEIATTYTETKVNGEIDESIFDMPADAE